MEKSRKLMVEFKKLFGFTAPIDVMLTPFVGYYALDIIALDEKLGTPDGTSTKDYIEQKYGNKAMECVEQWLAI